MTIVDPGNLNVSARSRGNDPHDVVASSDGKMLMFQLWLRAVRQLKVVGLPEKPLPVIDLARFAVRMAWFFATAKSVLR